MGIPYQDRGRSEDGVDCWGLYRLVLWRECGILLPDLSDTYESCEEVVGAAKSIEANGTATGDFIAILPACVRAMDLILLRMQGYPVHVGVVIEPGRMLHCERGHDTVAERYDGLRWNRRISGFYRHESIV